MSSFDWPAKGGGGGGITKYATAANLPGSASNGDVAVVVDTGLIYEYIAGVWTIVAGPDVILTVDDTASIDLTLTANELTADLFVSASAPDANNQAVALNIEPDGLRAQVADADIQSVISVTDTNTVDLSYSLGDITADVKLSATGPDVSNQEVDLIVETDGIRAQIPDTSIQSVISVSDTGTIDLTYTAGDISGVIVADSITNAEINTAAAIEGTKIDPDFGTQTIFTTSQVNELGDVFLMATEFGGSSVGGKIVEMASTGLLTGGVLSIDADPTKFDLSAGQGRVVDYTASTPTIKNVVWAAFNAQTVTNLASQDQTYILINNLGAIVQQSTFPTATQRRDNIFIGRLSHSSRTTIGTAISQPDFVQSPNAQLYDLIDALGNFNISGNIISANGANLKLDKSSGVLFTRGANYTTNAEDPHVMSQSSGSLISFGYNTQSTSITPAVTDVDVANYDLAGVVTAIGGGAGRSTIQRVYVFPTGQVRIQYGQTIYDTFNDAVAAFESETHITNPILADNAVLIAYIIATRTTTSLQSSSAVIIPAGKFGIVGGGSAAAASTAPYVDTFTGTTVTLATNPYQKWQYTGVSAQTITSIDFSLMPDGGRVVFIGSSNTNTITFPQTLLDCFLNGDRVLAAYSTIEFIKDGLALVEVTRNGI